MARRSGLGKGLGALIPTEVRGDEESALREVPLAAIRPNPRQPRTVFDEEMLTSLADSIRQLGVLQPVLVRPLESDPEAEYELIAGERRWRAARRAGLQTIPAIVRTLENQSTLEHALVENLHRQDLNPLEEAAAYQQLIEDFGLTHEEVATRVGKHRVTVTNFLRLLHLPASIQKLVATNELSAGHARALLSSPDRAFQEALARRAVAEGMSVRAVEEAVKARNGRPAPSDRPSGRTAPGRSPRPSEPGLAEVEQLLSEHLDTKVAVELGGKKGRIVIDFADLEDLERIYRRMNSDS